MAEDLYEVALLIDDLKNTDADARLHSIQNVQVIAKAFGPERTRTELLPYLADSVDDEDEVLLEMAKRLGTEFIPCVGGKDHIHYIFEPLRALAATEDPVVRETATRSLCDLVVKMPNNMVAKHFYPVIQFLFSKDWFTSRSSCCNLIPTAYFYIKDDSIKEGLRKMFATLSKDKKTIVRRAANKNLAKLVQVVETKYFEDSMMSLFQELAKDDQDSVRTLSVENIVSFMTLSKNDTARKEVVKVTTELSKDKSWKIRWNLSKNFREIFDVMEDEQEALEALIATYMELIKDDETEVRRIATRTLPEVAVKIDDKIVVNEILPEISVLASVPASEVREELANVITELIPVFKSLGKLDKILEPYKSLIGDEDAVVCLAVIGKLDTEPYGEKFIQEILPVLLPSFLGLVEDDRWRIRHDAIKLIPRLAVQLGVDHFTSSLADTTVQTLHDEAADNRTQASTNIRELYDLFGPEWIAANILSKLGFLSKHDNYLFRIQSVRVLQSLAGGAVDAKFLGECALPLLSELSRDSTANVKFNVAKCLQSLSPKLDGAAVSGEVAPILTQLQSDTDQDVAYFATTALQSIRAT